MTGFRIDGQFIEAFLRTILAGYLKGGRISVPLTGFNDHCLSFLSCHISNIRHFRLFHFYSRCRENNRIVQLFRIEVLQRNTINKDIFQRSDIAHRTTYGHRIGLGSYSVRGSHCHRINGSSCHRSNGRVDHLSIFCRNRFNHKCGIGNHQIVQFRLLEVLQADTTDEDVCQVGVRR